MIFNILKTIHIFSVISWMAGLLYLPRIFVYHADLDINPETSNIFKIMERRLHHFIMIPSAILTWITGIMMIHFIGIQTWLLLKIFFVILMTFSHMFFFKSLNNFKYDKNFYSAKFFRLTNEIPALILIVILILVVFKPY